jgi:hypothetical protein
LFWVNRTKKLIQRNSDSRNRRPRRIWIEGTALRMARFCQASQSWSQHVSYLAQTCYGSSVILHAAECVGRAPACVRGLAARSLPDTLREVLVETTTFGIKV